MFRFLLKPTPLKLTLIFISQYFCFISSHAQIEEIKSMKNWELLGYAKDAERVNDKYFAIDLYAEYLKRKPNKTKIAYKLAKMYFSINDFSKAKPLFEKVAATNKRKYYNSIYYLAEILRVQSKYDSAINLFNQYQEKYRKTSRKELLFYLADIRIESCAFAANNNQDIKNYQVKHLNTSINKAHMESAPAILDESSFVYSSLVADSIPVINKKEDNFVPFSKFYQAKRVNNKWTGGADAPSPFFNIDSMNVSNGAFSNDNKRFYFTVMQRNKFSKNVSSLYISHFKNNKWSKPVKLDEPINLKDFSSTQPAVSDYLKDFEVVYFVSDRPGGWGDYDIWYTVYNKSTGKYNKPVNAGGYLNSSGADITPYYDSETKTMYFSSDAQIGYGGLDVYRSNGSLVEWLPPENLGRPINSNYNDIYYIKQKTTEAGFLVSNRDESIALKNPNCCYDIFEFKLPEKLKIEVNGVIALRESDIQWNYEKHDKKKRQKIQPVNKQKIQLWMMSATTGISVRIENGITDENGTFTFKNIEDKRKYIIRVDDKTILKKRFPFNTDSVYSDTLIRLDTIFIELIPKKSIVFKNIYFDFGKANLTTESKKTIDNTLLKIMKENEAIVVEIGAHTDYLGRNDYNLKLSQKRAESVVNYLISKGVKKNRLQPVGYGEEKPLVPAQTTDGKDIPEAREKNRRIEFTIIGTTDDD